MLRPVDGHEEFAIFGFWPGIPNLKLELRVTGIAGPSWRREGRAVIRRGARVVMWREGREVMSSGPIDSVNISKLELRVLGIKAPARGEGPGAVES